MKIQVLKNVFVQLPVIVIVVCLVVCPAIAATENVAQEQIKAQYEYEAAMEKLKADIAESKKVQAEAERDSILAQLPPTKTEALSGDIDAQNFGAAGLIVAVDLAKKMAPCLCDAIGQGQTVLIYDATTISGIISAQVLDNQLDWFLSKLNDALKDKKQTTPVTDGTKGISLSIVTGLAVAAGTTKSLADLTSLFKTNITVSKTDFTGAKSLFLTSMASSCPEKITSLGEGYEGELDTAEFEKLRKKSMDIQQSKVKLENKITEVKKQLEKANSNQKMLLQKEFDDLSALGIIVNEFISIIKPYETSDKSPLPIAAKYLTLSNRSLNSYILDIDVKLEGLTILKKNIFTGQKLRLSATAITWYRLYDKSGKIIKAGVSREMAKPVKVNLCGNKVNDDFWSK